VLAKEQEHKPLTICRKQSKALVFTLTLASRVKQKRVRFEPLETRNSRGKGKERAT